MLVIVTHFIIVLGLIIGTTTDFKKREVPDWLNFSLIGLGLGLGLLGSVLLWSIIPFLSSLIGLIVGIIIGYVMFYAGQWGGGDAKLIMGLGALFGLNIFAGVQLTEIPVFLLFIINIVLVGAMYGLFWGFVVALRNWRKLRQELKKKLHEPKIIRYRIIVLVTAALLIFLAFISSSTLLVFSFAVLAFIIFFVFYLWIITKAVERTCMVKELPVSKLTEGDWIYKDLWFKASYRSFEEHLEYEAKQWLSEKIKYDSLLDFYRQLGWEKGIQRRTQTLKEKSLQRLKKRFTHCVTYYLKEDSVNKKQLLSALRGKKITFLSFANKHEKILPFLKERFHYAPHEQRVSGPADLGITREQIAELKQRKIKLVTVKEGIPFVPSFLLAYMVTMLVGNWLVFLL